MCTLYIDIMNHSKIKTENQFLPLAHNLFIHVYCHCAMPCVICPNY